MPKFKVELRFADSSVCETVEVEAGLSLDKQQCLKQRLDLEEEQFTNLDNGFVHISTITALEDIPSRKVKQGDVVFRDWDDLLENEADEEKIKSLLESYKPLWEVGSGYYYLLQLFDEDDEY